MTAWKLIMLGIAAPLALAALAPEATTAASGADPLTCAIRATPVTGGVRIEAVASAKSDVTGTYRLKVASGGDGGSNTIAQGGDFSAAAGERSTLSSVMLGGEAGGDYEAHLTVEWPGGRATCTASGPSRI